MKDSTHGLFLIDTHAKNTLPGLTFAWLTKFWASSENYPTQLENVWNWPFTKINVCEIHLKNLPEMLKMNGQ